MRWTYCASSVERSLRDSDWRECHPCFYAYDFKGPNHETLVIVTKFGTTCPSDDAFATEQHSG
jgi:hypothetical protein